jgi:hypothetical protein
VPPDVARDTTVVLGTGLDVVEGDDVERLRCDRGHAAPFRDRASPSTRSDSSSVLLSTSIGCIAVSFPYRFSM